GRAREGCPVCASPSRGHDGQPLTSDPSRGLTSAEFEKADWRLFRGPPRAVDVQQGELGDCWFLSSLACLADFQAMAREVLRGAAGARASADRLVQKLVKQHAESREDADSLRRTLRQLLGGFEDLIGDAELADRVVALIPALRALLKGETPSPEDVLRRNVALHADAEGESVAEARPARLRQMQRSARLEARRQGVGGAEVLGQKLCAVAGNPAVLREQAAPFWPRHPPGVWEQLDGAGWESRTASGAARAEARPPRARDAFLTVQRAGPWEPLPPVCIRCTCGAAVFASAGRSSPVGSAADSAEFDYQEVGAADAEVDTTCSVSEAAPQASAAVLAYQHAHPAARLSGGGGALAAPVAGGTGPGAGFEGSRVRRKRGASTGRRARRVRFDLRPAVIGTAFEEESEEAPPRGGGAGGVDEPVRGLWAFLDDLSVASIACAAHGPSLALERLLVLAEAQVKD
ncbi:unnamed protein product, partial [Prorocentrum cordatum]